MHQQGALSCSKEKNNGHQNIKQGSSQQRGQACSVARLAPRHSFLRGVPMTYVGQGSWGEARERSGDPVPHIFIQKGVSI